MTGCTYILRIGAFHDGELETSAAREVELHLMHCALCRDELAALQRVSALLGEAAGAEMAAGAVDRIHDRIEGPETLILSLGRYLSGAAAAVLVVGLGWLWVLQSTPTQAALPAWEQAAMLQPETLPAGAVEELNVAQWILSGLDAQGDQR